MASKVAAINGAPAPSSSSKRWSASILRDASRNGWSVPCGWPRGRGDLLPRLVGQVAHLPDAAEIGGRGVDAGSILAVIHQDADRGPAARELRADAFAVAVVESQAL